MLHRPIRFSVPLPDGGLRANGNKGQADGRSPDGRSPIADESPSSPSALAVMDQRTLAISIHGLHLLYRRHVLSAVELRETRTWYARYGKVLRSIVDVSSGSALPSATLGLDRRSPLLPAGSTWPSRQAGYPPTA